ncbi:MAG: hypothetical protein HKL95_07645 [Phycisphaerae bacterium]|nr:hypothetical protein [Phycisphaerae bacterium]
MTDFPTLLENPMHRQMPFVTVLIVLLCIPIAGCRSKNSRQFAPQGVTYVYHLKGIIRSLPVPMQGPSSMMIKMQAIPNWTGITGQITPMAAMTMPCQLAKTVSQADLAVGDKIAFTYKVNWVQDRMLITRLKKLPPTTSIHFNLAPNRP